MMIIADAPCRMAERSGVPAFSGIETKRPSLSPIRSLAILFVLMAGLVLPDSSWAADQDFTRWLGGVRQEALAAGINPATIDRAFDGLEPIERVIELDRKQPETTVTFEYYLSRVVDAKRRRAAREHFAANRKLLTEIGRRYGV